ncbi:hypothetical protein NCG89_09310 [Spongiibacter taiwanensis]|uniref:diacylglycerol/lipid kinase family protein n=1 Tax=Spongiibacter taiwanensis TaxID=1748242 RepID=UPI002034EC59|nr:diacylglycerol kinase family protein [Spongiibacter taiwanensis]USA41716.1 hypothetical protein NCG89_09310 [Spongiibacter taiwanensis]
MSEQRPQGPYFIVLNDGAGSQAGSTLRQQIRQTLTEAAQPFEFIDSESTLAATAARAVSQARERGGIVVAAGGDGTLNTVAQAVLGSDIVMGIIPGGTFNYFARSLGIPESPADAALALATAEVKPVQLGLVNQRVFLVNASLGLYPKLLEDREAYKQRYGRSRTVALLSALVTLSQAHRRLHISLQRDGVSTQMHSVSVLINNNPLQLHQVGVDGADAIGDGKLVAIAARPRGRLSLYGLLLRGLISRLGEADQIESFPLRRMTVMLGRRKRVKVATDGEIQWLTTPLHFAVAEQKLSVLIPSKDRAT